MPDPTPTPPPAPAPKGNRSTLNQDWINSLNNAGQIVAAAKKAEYDPVFATGGITAAKLTALATDIAAAHALAGDAAHIALATVHEMDVLLSRNCRHIANAAIQARLRRLAEKSGCTARALHAGQNDWRTI